MKPGCSKKNGQEDEKCDIAAMKPGMLIEAYANDCAQKKDGQSPATELLTGCVALDSNALSSADEADKTVAALIGTRNIHTA